MPDNNLLIHQFSFCHDAASPATILLINFFVGDCTDVFLNEPSGQVSSPGFPYLYPSLSDCGWTIKVRISLRNFVRKLKPRLYETFYLRRFYFKGRVHCFSMQVVINKYSS